MDRVTRHIVDQHDGAAEIRAIHCQREIGRARAYRRRRYAGDGLRARDRSASGKQDETDYAIQATIPRHCWSPVEPFALAHLLPSAIGSNSLVRCRFPTGLRKFVVAFFTSCASVLLGKFRLAGFSGMAYATSLHAANN